MIGLTHTRTHTHTHSLSLFPFLCLPPSPLVAFQSRDQPLADRTGPLGSCYRPPQRRDWKALIAALRSPQSRENHSVSVIGSLTWDGGKREGRREQTERGNERQVTHLVMVKEGKQGEESAEREWQRLSKRERGGISKRDKREEGACESLSYCLHAVYQRRQ